MQSAHIQGQISYALSLIDTNVNMAVKTFNQCITEATHCTETKIFVGKEKMRTAGLTMIVLLQDKMFENCFASFRNLSVLMIESHSQSRREYKNMLKHKKQQYKDKQLSELLDALGNQSYFWKNVDQIAPKCTRTAYTIPIDTRYQHFQTVL